MKKTLSAFVVILSVLPFIANAQWSGTSPIYYNGGSVGIGTSSPANTLEVQNSTGGWLMNLRTNAPLPGNINGLKFYSGYLGDTVKWAGISSIAENMHSNLTGLALYSNATENMRIAANGYVGVGTQTPTRKFTVSTFGDGSSTTPLLRLEQYNPGSPVGGTGVSIDMAIGDNYNLPTLAGQIRLVRSDYINTSMYFATAFNNTLTDRMVINPFGSVGIGTLTPDAKLAVNGTIHTQEVKVDMTGWSDYVFKPSYKLIPLSEVKTYIEQNQHLPEVPSEQEVKKDGVNLGEMNKLLLKKVEELTLYLIEQNKTNQTQQEQLDQLKKQLDLLTKKQ